MKKNANQEDRLITSMLEDMEISQAGSDFTNEVMERISLETLPVNQQSNALISRRAWIVIGILISLLLVFLITGMSQETASPVVEGESILHDLTEFGSLMGTIMEWFSRAQDSLTWYTISLASVFFLTLIDRFLRTFRPRHSFVF